MPQHEYTPGEESENSDADSASSSVIYEQEPFETFRAVVLEFAQGRWNEANIEVERLSGGGFNRIIGITTRKKEQQEAIDYILRVPRFNAAKIDQDVAALRFVQALGGIPIPEIVAFDETSNNKLGNPYMIQSRLKGTSLLDSFPELDHDDKCKVAAELGRIFNRLLDAKSNHAGIISLKPHGEDSSKEQVVITPFFETDAKLLGHLQDQTGTTDLLKTIFTLRTADGEKRYPLDTIRPKLFSQFMEMAGELDADGWFQDVPFSLCHLDLEPRNILVDATHGKQRPIITGILDWDSAVLAPSFMSCKPPQWIWDWQDDEDEDEQTANDVPPTKECIKLKIAFEMAAGWDYMLYAYSPVYRLARRLVRFAIDGIRSAEDIDEAEKILEEWSQIRPSSIRRSSLQGSYSSDDLGEAIRSLFNSGNSANAPVSSVTLEDFTE